MDKLTYALTVKVAPERLPVLQQMAAYHGMEVSEYIRHLIDSDYKLLQQQHAALDQIFGKSAKADKGYLGRAGGTEDEE